MLGEKSRYCPDHSDLATTDESETEPPTKKSRIVVTINTVDMKVSTKVMPLIGDIPDNDDRSVHIGCKKERNVNRFSSRSAGIMAIVKPCGIIVDVSEMLTCESPSQLFVQLLRLKCETNLNVSYLGYDRGCEFAPFLKNLQKKGNPGAEVLLDKVKFLVDRFHIAGHTTPQCDINDDKCQYHPDLPQFQEISGVNTECAEQCFAWLGKFKHTMKYMSQYKFKFFLYTIVSARNKQTEKKLKRKNLM